MANGGYLPISEIDIGDYVIAADQESGERSRQPVLDVIVGYGTKHIVAIDTDLDPLTAPLKATSNHPFWVVGQGWVEAGDVRVGDEMISPDGAISKVALVDDQGELDEELVYNLTVGNLHTFIVATSGGDEVLTHNDNDKLPKSCKLGNTLNEADAARIAKKMGAVVAGGEKSQEARVYKLGNIFIVRDRTGHRGGGWKSGPTIKSLGSKSTRAGTHCKHMCHRVGD